MIDALIIVAAIFAVLAFACAAWSLIQVEAFKRSTHQVTFVDPAKQSFEPVTDDVKEKLRPAAKDFDNIM
jgi:hypothetical protein